MIVDRMKCLLMLWLEVKHAMGHGFLLRMGGRQVMGPLIANNRLLCSMIRSLLLVLIVCQNMNGFISFCLRYLFISLVKHNSLVHLLSISLSTNPYINFQ